MSAKERDRLKVLHEVQERHITQKQAAGELRLSVRWVRELLVRVRARGDGALRHGLRGRPSNRKTAEAVKQQAVQLYRQKKQAKLWHDYGPTLAMHWRNRCMPLELCTTQPRATVERIVRPRATPERSAEEKQRARQRVLDARRRLKEAYAQLPNRPIWQAMKDFPLRAGELR